MFRVDAGRTNHYCDGLSRRSFLQLGLTGLTSLTAADVLRSRASAAPAAAKDTSVILLWLDGGPSHLDLYDLKPEAPAEYRGIWSPIRTNVPGIEISELFPRQAKVADKFSIIRSVHHETGDHFTAAHEMLTGAKSGVGGNNMPGKLPFIGSIATRATGPRQAGIPANVAVPIATSIGLRPGYFGGNYLGSEHDPFETGGEPESPNFKVQNLQLPSGLSLDRLENRRGLVTHFDRLRRDLDASHAFDTLDQFQRDAFELVASSRAAAVFDLTREDDKTRDRYGRNKWGQSTLLARRLVEAGSTVVSVHCNGWDHHWNLESELNKLLPQIDQLLSALLEDLHARSLSDKVLVVMCGEFGRTPKMNNGQAGGNATPGRDHWGNAMFCLMGGGGVQGGRIVGSTDAKAERPKDRPLTPSDLHATLFHVLGVDLATYTIDRSGRPIAAIPNGHVIEELF